MSGDIKKVLRGLLETRYLDKVNVDTVLVRTFKEVEN